MSLGSICAVRYQATMNSRSSRKVFGQNAARWTAALVLSVMLATALAANTNQEFTIPVQSGLIVTRLRGLIHAPVDFGAGFVRIDDSTGRFLATVGLPAVTPDQVVVPFDVDISPAQVSESDLGLSFTVREVGLRALERCGLGE
jgi:hypothetical protein